jgi:aarF domain-containing kinase
LLKVKSIKIYVTENNLFVYLQDLEPKFKRRYAQLWLSILNSDTTAMKRIATELGVGDLYWLFSCMVTGRTWEAISGGITKSRLNSSEVIKLLKTIILTQ